MIYEITCKDSNNEVKTLTIQDTDKIKISLENNKDGDFITYPLHYNSFNQALFAAYIILTYPKLTGSRLTEAMDFINKYLYYFNKEDINND